MPRMKKLAWVVPALLLAGCEFEIPGQKAKDAAAMGYACRISKKSPELCMRENPAFSQTAVLEGWRDADKDVKDKKVDTNFAVTAPAAIKPAGEEKTEGEAGAAAAPPTQEGEKKPPEAEAKPVEPAKGH